jgi:predicted ATP-grasp superfamily ATP-dependent carboligase
MTELEIDKSMHRSIAQKMVEWTIDSECNLVISAAAIPYGNGDDNGSDDVYVGDNMPGKIKPPVYAVSSTQYAAKKIRDAGFSHLSSGSVTGIPGIVKRRSFDWS